MQRNSFRHCDRLTRANDEVEHGNIAIRIAAMSGARVPAAAVVTRETIKAHRSDTREKAPKEELRTVRRLHLCAA